MIIEDKIKSGHARTLIAIENNDQQYELAVKIFDEQLSVRETEKLIRKIKNDSDKAKKVKPNNNQENIIYKEYEEKLKNIMGTKVNINHKAKGKGKIEIEYYSQDEFERLMELMSKVSE